MLIIDSSVAEEMPNSPSSTLLVDDDCILTRGNQKDQLNESYSTDINCPDCGVTVLLSSLTTHIQHNCLKKNNDEVRICN